MSDDRNPSPSGETWVCRANPAVYGVCTSPIGAIPGHNGCGPVPSSDTPSDERDEVCGSMGPRIGDEPERPRCAQPLDHDGQHRGFPGSGFESVQWGGPIVRDGDFARTYRPAPPAPAHPGGERPAGEWTAVDLLADLNDRAERAMVELEKLAAPLGLCTERTRLLGKLAGLALVADWIRSYDHPTDLTGSEA